MRTYLQIIFLLFFNVSWGQEQLVPIGSNPVIKSYILRNPLTAFRTTFTVTPIDLPVIDDFSNSGVYPDTSIWSDNYVFINQTLARNPITIGTATFDGLDALGNAYVNNNAGAQGSCDTLTSKPIFLLTRPSSQGGGQYSIADSITLGFFYEKKGLGDAPDNADSLVLEFYNPTTDLWSRQWYLRGGLSAGQDTLFNEVNLRIVDTAFIKDGFRFRFRNFGALTGALDHWHLDYVRLFKGINGLGQMDTSLMDVAMVMPVISLLNTYTSIPWEHYKSLSIPDRESLMRPTGDMIYRNAGTTLQDIGFNNRVYDYTGGYVQGHGADNGNIFSGIVAGQKLIYQYPVDTLSLPITPEISSDSTFFTVRNYFSNGNSFGGLKSNDTTEYTQEFYNYYSYDDGTAEAGYDLVNSPQGKLAQRFDLLRADTIRSVRMHFVQQNSSVSNLLFTLKIWSSLNPEIVIFQQTNVRPVYTDTLNGFANYVLNQLVPVSGTIYIGFQQVSQDGLHLGFDRNTNSNTKMFYNFNGSWANVNVATGSFMIRPVFGDSTLFVGLSELSSTSINLYPNPANSVLHIRYSIPELVSGIAVTSIDGRNIQNLGFSETLNTLNYAPGVYFIHLHLNNGKVLMKRFAINH